MTQFLDGLSKDVSFSQVRRQAAWIVKRKLSVLVLEKNVRAGEISNDTNVSVCFCYSWY